MTSILRNALSFFAYLLWDDSARIYLALLARYIGQHINYACHACDNIAQEMRHKMIGDTSHGR
jgi:hypothetical protein